MKILLLFFVLLPAAAQAQSDKPEAPKPKVIDRQFLAAMMVLAGTKIADFSATAANLGHGCLESNPILGDRPSDAHIAAFAAASFGAEFLGAYFVKRFGQRHRWARHLWLIQPAVQSGSHIYAVHLWNNCR